LLVPQKKKEKADARVKNLGRQTGMQRGRREKEAIFSPEDI